MLYNCMIFMMMLVQGAVQWGKIGGVWEIVYVSSVGIFWGMAVGVPVVGLMGFDCGDPNNMYVFGRLYHKLSQ